MVCVRKRPKSFLEIPRRLAESLKELLLSFIGPTRRSSAVSSHLRVRLERVLQTAMGVDPPAQAIPELAILSNAAALHSLKRPQLVALCKQHGLKGSGKVSCRVGSPVTSRQRI
jgi:hypothetical protein